MDLRTAKYREVRPGKAPDQLSATHPEHEEFSDTEGHSAIPPQSVNAGINTTLPVEDGDSTNGAELTRLGAATPELAQISDRAPDSLSANPPKHDQFGNTKCLINATELNNAKCSEILPDKAPKSISATPPERDPLSDTDCLSTMSPEADNASTNVAKLTRAQKGPN